MDGLAGNIKNQWLSFVTIFLMAGSQVYDPIIDHWLGQDQDQIDMVREEIKKNAIKRDSLWSAGVDRMMQLDTGLHAVKIFLRSKEQTEGNATFAIGLRGTHGNDSVWYRASDGKMHDVLFDPSVMWWKYRDGWTEKAVLFEVDWDFFYAVAEQTRNQ